ncbi:TetR/AcrR family transcriptional regulator [Nocardia sp. NPDC088792]|uniref:TetR/AcrR family transcriptional regulator n=1 Tax=Nocardia sp. NPDC088792 TaxID=3364332 RepID=UPI0038175DE7
MPQPRRTQQERVDESTQRLLHAAAALIAEGGYDAASAAEIGRRAGYSRSMVRARFGSKEQLIDAVIRAAYEGPLTVPLPGSATGMERVLARIDAMGRLIDENPALLRMLFAVEFQAAGKGSGMAVRAAGWIGRLRGDILEALSAGQRDGSISGDLDAEATAHAIVVEGVGSAFLWTVDPAEDFPRRIDQWRTRTIKALRP